VQALFAALLNIVQVTALVTICGDIHGQSNDLQELFRVGGQITYTNYLFMGDCIDRGLQSVETLTSLFCLNITLLRDNRESAGISQHFGFRKEVIERSSDDAIWQIYTQTFNSFPLAAIVSSPKVSTKILCVHCDLSLRPNLTADIEAFDRFRELPPDGLMSNFVWGDPRVKPGVSRNRRRGRVRIRIRCHAKMELPEQARTDRARELDGHDRARVRALRPDRNGFQRIGLLNEVRE
jgi:diadenosine tetraphosphatase ApaH/serine/threonine PP2A family protein phosphatase